MRPRSLLATVGIAVAIGLLGTSASAVAAAPSGVLAYSDGTSVFSVPADGSTAPKRLGAGTQPQWSPDGKQIAWTGKGGVWVAKASGAKAKLVAKGGSLPTWSPSATRLAYLLNTGDLWSARPDGTAARRLLDSTSNEFENLSLDGDTAIFDLAWSPQGTKIGVLAWGGNGVVGAAMVVLTVDAGGDHAMHQLLNSWTIGAGPTVIGPGLAWSPDGRTLAIGAETNSAAPDPSQLGAHVQEGPPYTVLMSTGAGHKTKTFLGPPTPGIVNAGFSPDGKRLCGSTNQGLAVLDLASHAITAVAVPALATDTLTTPSLAPPTFTCSWRRGP